MTQLTPAAAHWFADHHGVADRATLRRLGLSPDQIDHRARVGLLVRIHHGVYRSTQWPETEIGRCIAACMAAPSAVISHGSAARLWGLRRCGTNDIHVSIPLQRTWRADGVVVHRTGTLERSDIVRRADGIRLTNPVRTVCDVAALVSDEDLASVIEQVLDEHRVRYATIARTAYRLIGRGWPASTRLRAVLEGRPDGAAPHDSHLELRLARALVRAGLPEPVRQLPITLLDGMTIHADLAYPARRLVIEIDHRTWHSGAQAALDKRRDRLVRLAGYSTVRVTDDDLRQRFASTVDEVVAIHALARRARVA